jgi:hypothetical protein
MKQFTEAELRELLERAYQEGLQAALDEERGVCICSTEDEWDRKRDETLNQLMESV